MMANFTLFSFLVLVTLSQVLGRMIKIEPDNPSRLDLENEIDKKRNSFALSSIYEAQFLSGSEFIRKVLKGVAFDLAVLRKNVKKTLLSLQNLSEKSETPNSETSSGAIPPQNGILGLGQDSNYKNQNNEAQLSSANGAENFGKPVDNSVYNSGSQPGYSLGGLPKLVQSGSHRTFHGIHSGSPYAYQNPWTTTK